MTPPVAHTGAGNVTTATNAAAATITVAKPANVADGDVLVAILNNSIAGGTWDIVPAGWALQAQYNTVRNTAVFTRPIPSAAAEAATDYTWHTTGGAGRIGGLIFRVTGVDGAAPVDAVGAGVGTGGASIVDPAVTAASPETLLVAVFSSYIASTPNTVTAPGSMAAVGGWAVTTGTASTTTLVCAEAMSASGSTGTRTATVSPSGSGATGIMIALAPGSVTPPPAGPVAHTGAGDLTTAVVTSSAVLRCPRPSNVTSGDLLVAVLHHRNGGDLFSMIPPGWTAWPTSYVTNGVLAAYWRHIENAATEPDYYTWRSPNGSARGAATVFRVTGAAPPNATGGPVDSAGAATGSGAVSIVAPATTIVAPAALLIGCYCSTAVTTTPATITAPAEMTEAVGVPVVTGTAASYLEVATQAINATGPTGTRTATVDPAASTVTGFLLAVAPPGHGAAQPAELLARLAGGVTATGAKVTAATKFASSARFAVSTSPSLSSPAYTAVAALDRDGLVSGQFSALTPDTRYYWGVELDGVLHTSAVATFRTLPSPGAPASFSFAAASCAATNSDAASFADAATRTGPTGEKALFTVHLGDMHYQDQGVNDPAWSLGAWLNALTRPNQQMLYAAAPLAYTWSDHDFGGSNVSASSAAAPGVQAVYRRLFPSYPLPGDGVGIYQSWQVGRVLFVLTDGRSYMSPITDPDTAAKTKLGAAQKEWFKSQLLTSGVNLVVWLHEDAWHNQSTFVNDDTWSAYTAERDELAQFIADHQVPLLYVHGDVHALSHDDGSHVHGGFPLISCSPWDQTTFIGNGLLTGGYYPYPVSSSVRSEQYGWFDVIDDGSQVVVRWYGISGGAAVMRAEMSWGIGRRIGWGIAL